MDRTRLVGLALGGDVALTLVTGLLPLRTLAGATHDGFPMAWSIRRVLAPEHVPWRVDWLGLVVDLVAWTALVFVLLVLSDRFGHRRPRGQTT